MPNISITGARSAAAGKPVVIDPSLAISMGLATPAYALLLRAAGFQPIMPRILPSGAYGPLAPPRWRWKPTRREAPGRHPPARPPSGAFAVLADLVR